MTQSAGESEEHVARSYGREEPQGQLVGSIHDTPSRWKAILWENDTSLGQG